MGKYPFNVNLWYRTRYSAAVVCALALMVPPLSARNRKGDKLLKAGQRAESLKDYDSALAYYDQAVSADPNEPAYLLADQRIRSRAAEAHVILGRRLQSEGKLEEALAQFEKAFLADPSSQVALQNIRDTNAMIKQRAAGPAGAPVITPAERARQEMERRINSLEGPPVLRPINSQISNLRINNQPARVLYESVGKLAGINVLCDPSGIEAAAGKNYNIDLSNVTLQEALNYIALQTHTFWKPISQNAIFVTQESDPKRQEYQDEVIKVFYVQNASTANEFTEIFNAVRTAARLTVGVQSVPSQNAIIARGSVDTMALVEKLVHDLDRPKAEVVVDVIVMSANRTKTTNLGASILGVGGLTAPFTFTPRNPTTTPSTGTGTGTTPSTGTGTGTSTSTTSAFTLARAGHFSSADYSTTFPSTVVKALLNDATTRILQRPQVRATDGGKSSILIGSSIPIVSGSLNSAVATPGSIPYATTQFQQVPVGTQIEFAPHVNGTEDISMHIKIELSNVLQRISIAGVEQPVIGKQTDEADLRMKDGEVTIVGGLSDKEFNSTLGGVPGLANIPALGYLFGQRDKTNTDNEILIAMIPHIVRALDFSAAGGLGVYAGSERVVRVERKREPSNPAPAPALAVPGATAPPASPLSPASPTPGPATTPGVVPTPNPRPPVTNPPAPNNPPVTNPQRQNPAGASATPAANRPPQ